MTEPTLPAEEVRVWSHFDLHVGGKAPLSGPFKVRCPDGRVRWMMDRSRCGFLMSGNRHTQGLWWHDLVNWKRVGIGPALWDWSGRARCSHRAPNGQQCGLPNGHASYLGLPHRLKSGRRFVRRVTGYWPTTDPKRVAA